MNTLQNFLQIVDRHTVLVTALALFFTFVCRQIGFVFDMPTNLLGIAVVFPLVFSIVSAYRRREDALKYFASLKAHAIALYFAHRDWPGAEESLEDEGGKLLYELFTAVAAYFQADQQRQEQELNRVYQVFDAFSKSHEQMRQHGVTSGEVSRANQYFRAIMIEFERMKNISRYRTPVALRAYSRLFLTIFPILFAPYFANVAYPNFPFAGYMVAIFYSLILVSLDNVQDHLENPFDGIGPDDLRLEIADKYLSLLATPSPIKDE
ncbi:MAG: hypothetical protein GY796_16210 [Chloroflexi bacterium]|nr:hypothetical protein [Chloroflexota bacterium]